LSFFKIPSARHGFVPQIYATGQCLEASMKSSFVCLCGYYRRHIAGFASIAAPLHALISNGAEFKWMDECGLAFDSLKSHLTNAPILSFPIDTDGCVLDTDASDVGLGAVLSEIQNGEEKVMAYASKILSKAERNYDTTKKELLAVMYDLKQ
jgi:hypothetical protein